MNILIPMAGEGQRFQKGGYTQPKPLIPVTSRKTGQLLPMVVAAIQDIPQNNTAPLTLVTQKAHQHWHIQEALTGYYPKARFIEVDQLTSGQATTCLAASPIINTNDSLFIGACDNGMDLNNSAFIQATQTCDALILTFRHDQRIVDNPKAYGWVQTNGETTALSVSVKQPISSTPLSDHAIVGSFWFKRGANFVEAAQELLDRKQTIQNEYYVDSVMQVLIDLKYHVRVFEIERYVGWGTPNDYEAYEKTLAYWKAHWKQEEALSCKTTTYRW